MASYILTWDKKRLFFSPSPYQLRPMGVQMSTAAGKVSSEKNLIDMKLLVKIISSKLEYTPRKVPDEKDIIDTDSHVSLYFLLYINCKINVISVVLSTCNDAKFSPTSDKNLPNDNSVLTGKYDYCDYFFVDKCD